MRRVVLVLVSLVWSGFAIDFATLLKGVDKNRLLKSKSYEIKAKEALLGEAKAKNLPSVDAMLSAVRLKEQPTIYMHLPTGTTPFPMGKRSRFEGEIGISYPIFTGYAVTNLIEKRKIKRLAAILWKKNLKRELYLKSSELYGSIYSLKAYEKALKEAKKALDMSYKKAKGFYEQGLIPVSDLYNIEAKKFETEAKIEEIRAKEEEVRAYLRYISGLDVKEADIFPVTLPKSLDIEQREDILALKRELLADRKDVDLAKSAFYPSLVAKGALKRFGDSLELDGDGYKNADESYVGAVVKYNLFNGFGDRCKVEAARFKVLAKRSYIKDYLHKANTNLLSNLKILNALKAKKEAAAKGVEAARSYYKLTLGRYIHQLASADELSRSIASLAEAQARLRDVEAKIFSQKCKILLISSLKTFKRVIR